MVELKNLIVTFLERYTAGKAFKGKTVRKFFNKFLCFVNAYFC